MSDMKKALDIIKSRLYITGEMTSELEDIAIESMQNETHRKKYRITRINRISISLGVTSKSIIIITIKNGSGRKIFEKLMTWTFSNDFI